MLAQRAALADLRICVREVAAAGSRTQNAGKVARGALSGLLGRVGAARYTVLSLGAAHHQRRLARAGVFRGVVNDARRRIAEDRVAAFRRLEAVLARLRQEARDRLAPLVEEYTRRAEAAKREAEKLGMAGGLACES